MSLQVRLLCLIFIVLMVPGKMTIDSVENKNSFNNLPEVRKLRKHLMQKFCDFSDNTLQPSLSRNKKIPYF